MRKKNRNWKKWGDGMALISREALRNYIVEAINKQEGLSIDYVKVGEVLAVIDMQPTIEAVPVVHAEWIEKHGNLVKFMNAADVVVSTSSKESSAQSAEQT